MDNTNKIKHLEFIQSIIARMNSNSFMLKGWTVTLVVGLFALNLTEINIPFIKLPVLPIVVFWILDGFYVYQERLFRKLYDKVRITNEDEIDFSMNRDSNFMKFICQFFFALSWRTVPMFYGPLFLIAIYFMRSLK